MQPLSGRIIHLCRHYYSQWRRAASTVSRESHTGRTRQLTVGVWCGDSHCYTWRTRQLCENQRMGRYFSCRIIHFCWCYRSQWRLCQCLGFLFALRLYPKRSYPHCNICRRILHFERRSCSRADWQEQSGILHFPKRTRSYILSHKSSFIVKNYIWFGYLFQWKHDACRLKIPLAITLSPYVP